MITLIVAFCAGAGLLTPPKSPLLTASTIAALHSSEIPLKAPSGWKSEAKEGATLMTPGDLASDKVYTVVVTPLQTKAGALSEVYDAGVKMMAEVGNYTPAMTPKTLKSDGGWDYEFSIGTVEKSGKGLFAQVMGLKKEDDGGIVIVISDSIETMQKYADEFGNMIRSLGGSASPPPAPAVAASSGTVDLQYTVPEGWTETKKEGAAVLEASKDDFYTKYRWTAVIMPSQPLKGSIRDNFREYWSALITANYTSSVVPLPLIERLDNGYAIAFDADVSAKHKATGAAPRTVSVYLLAHGDRFVPIMLITYGYETQLNTDFAHFIETARIPGSSDAKFPLFSSSEIVGNWSEGSSSIASYVTSSGAYAGDASIYTGSYFDLRADGTFTHVFIGISGSTHLKEKSEGKWSIDDDDLVLKSDKGDTRYSLLGYGDDPKAGRYLVMGTYSGVKAKLSYSNPRGPLQASWFKVK